MKNIFKLFLLLAAFASPFALQAAANQIEKEFDEISVLFTSSTTTFEKIKDKFDALSEADKKALLAFTDNHEATLLHRITLSKLNEKVMKKSIKLFVNNSANVDAVMKNGFTPLYLASFKGHYKVVEFLYNNRAAFDAEDKDGITPLHVAALQGHDKVVELLLEYVNLDYADIDKQDKNGSTPLHRAASKGHKKVVEILLLNHADINRKMENGFTPLHFASLYGHKEVVKLLLERGADRLILTNKGESAKDLYNIFIANKLNQNRLPAKRILQFN